MPLCERESFINNKQINEETKEIWETNIEEIKALVIHKKVNAHCTYQKFVVFSQK